MRKGKSLLGLAVVGQEDGTQLGHVKDLLFDAMSDEIVALILSEKDLFGLIKAQIVPWSEIRSLGSQIIFAANANSKVALDTHERARGVLERETVLSGTQIYTVGGKHLGSVADMVIDEVTGKVTGYEISGGWVADTLRGKKFLPAPPGLTLGENAAIVSSEGAEALETKRPG